MGDVSLMHDRYYTAKGIIKFLQHKHYLLLLSYVLGLGKLWSYQERCLGRLGPNDIEFKIRRVKSATAETL